jgi:predicted TIM-barrel fold metal-dependent hydrolase
MFIDIHAHAYRRPWPGPNGKPLFSTPEQILKRYAKLGVERGVLLPLISPEFYLPQSNEDILDFAEKSMGKFIPFCCIDPRAVTNSPNAPLDYILRYYRDLGCKGCGEVCANLPFLDPLVQNLFRHLEDVSMPVIFHIGWQLGGVYGLYDDPGLGQLETSLQKFPKLKFLGHSQTFWAEIGKLENLDYRAGYPNGPIKEEGTVPKLMRRYPNLYGDLSAGSGHNALARDPNYAVKFLHEFQDKLFFGMDLCAPDTPAPLVDFLLDLRNSGRLDESAFQKIARENARQLLDLPF